jgi:hypothetical protein
MKRLSRRDRVLMILFAFVAAGTAIVVFYWLLLDGRVMRRGARVAYRDVDKSHVSHRLS